MQGSSSPAAELVTTALNNESDDILYFSYWQQIIKRLKATCSELH